MALIGTRRQTINKRRKGKLAVVLPWLKRFGVLLAILVALGWLGSWFFLSDADTATADWIENKTLKITANMGFTVENILVEGRVHSDADVLKAIINVKRGDPLFSFNPAEAKALVERVAWVKSARVERRFPNTIYIELTEREPLALWQKDKKLSVLDQKGEVITSSGLSPFKDLIIVLGGQAPAHAPALFADLKAEPLIYERTKSVSWVGNRRWDVQLKSGVSVKLPEEDIGYALRRLAAAQEQDNLLDKDLSAIDLREAGRIVVRTRPGAVQEYKASVKAGSNI
ncbi:MAG: FtsQ-type POTRA domain-containing protein [Alphaproteobacteria bacterium]|nr:FtsQ-type POTRA domain-containing protein [Alphaproteobacteria bacterium]